MPTTAPQDPRDRFMVGYFILKYNGGEEIDLQGFSIDSSYSAGEIRSESSAVFRRLPVP